MEKDLRIIKKYLLKWAYEYIEKSIDEEDVNNLAVALKNFVNTIEYEDYYDDGGYHKFITSCSAKELFELRIALYNCGLHLTALRRVCGENIINWYVEYLEYFTFGEEYNEYTKLCMDYLKNNLVF